MKHLQKTLYLVLSVLLYADMSFAAFSDYIVAALDEVNIQLDKVATVQDDYSAMSQEYTQGKLGEMGDLQASIKQAKKIEQAQKSLEKMQEMQKKLQKSLADAQKFQEDTLAKVQEMQALKDETLGIINETKDAYTQQIKAAQDLAQQSYEKANAQFESVSAQSQEMQNKINEQKAAQGELGDDGDDLDISSHEAESNRVAFNPNNVANITPLPAAMDTVQYNLPQGISEDGMFLPETIPSQPMTMLPEMAEMQKTTGMIENAALKATLPNQEMLQQLPDAAQLLEAPAGDVLQFPVEVPAENAEKDKPVVNEKTKLSLEEQLLAADENRMPTMSPEEFRAYLAAKDAEKRAARPQRDIQAEKEQFQQKLQALDEAKRASLGLKSSRKSFGTAKSEPKSEGGLDE